MKKKSTGWVFLLMIFIIFGIVGTMSYSIYTFINYVAEEVQPLRLIDDINEVNVINENVTKQILINMNNQNKPSLEFVSATEYTKGDGNGSTIIKLTDWRGDKINTTCYEKILYPDKTTYIDWSLMTQHWEYGNYYMNFVVPEPLGIYDQEVRCFISTKNVSIGKGFHVGNISNVVTSNIDDLKVDVMSVVS